MQFSRYSLCFFKLAVCFEPGFLLLSTFSVQILFVKKQKRKENLLLCIRECYHMNLNNDVVLKFSDIHNRHTRQSDTRIYKTIQKLECLYKIYQNIISQAISFPSLFIQIISNCLLSPPSFHLTVINTAIGLSRNFSKIQDGKLLKPANSPSPSGKSPSLVIFYYFFSCFTRLSPGIASHLPENNLWITNYFIRFSKLQNLKKLNCASLYQEFFKNL